VNESFSAKIQEAIISVCIENYSSQGIEVDGIVCVSFKNPTSNCVVKIHKILSKQQKLANLLKSNELQNNQIVETDIITSITSSLIGRAVIQCKVLVIMYKPEAPRSL
jgi:nucleoside-triphosphatase THEP1